MHMEACRHRREHGAVSGPHLKPGSGRPVPHPSTQTPPPPRPVPGLSPPGAVCKACECCVAESQGPQEPRLGPVDRQCGAGLGALGAWPRACPEEGPLQ